MKQESPIGSDRPEVELSMRRVYELILWGLLAAFCVSTVGCNTIEGLGRDIEEAGMAIQEACR